MVLYSMEAESSTRQNQLNMFHILIFQMLVFIHILYLKCVNLDGELYDCEEQGKGYDEEIRGLNPSKNSRN